MLIDQDSDVGVLSSVRPAAPAGSDEQLQRCLVEDGQEVSRTVGLVAGIEDRVRAGRFGGLVDDLLKPHGRGKTLDRTTLSERLVDIFDCVGKKSNLAVYLGGKQIEEFLQRSFDIWTNDISVMAKLLDLELWDVVDVVLRSADFAQAAGGAFTLKLSDEDRETRAIFSKALAGPLARTLLLNEDFIRYNQFT